MVPLITPLLLTLQNYWLKSLPKQFYVNEKLKVAIE